MIYDKETCRFVLATGRTFDSGANHAIGLDGEDLTVGYDCRLSVNDDQDNPTVAEKIEIADFVIAQWTAFKASLAQPDGRPRAPNG